MFFRVGRFGGGLVFGETTFRILTALVESSDDGMIRGLQLEDFHVSGERVIEVDLCGTATMVVQDVACPRCASACGLTVPKTLHHRFRRPSAKRIRRHIWN